jgi:hypothetical protein
MPDRFLRSVEPQARHLYRMAQGQPGDYVLRTPRADGWTERAEWWLARIDPWVGYGIVGLAGFLIGWWVFGQ